MPAPLALDIRRVSKLYGRTAALRGVSLQVHAGEVLALLGPNGSGKTTLLKILAGAVSPTLGSLSVFGHHPQRDRAFIRPQVGLLAGETYLYDDLTALENLRFTATMGGLGLEPEGPRKALQQVGLEESADVRVRSFSSGMKRRLALARTLLFHPRLLLLDEPYNSLDLHGADLVDGAVSHTAATGGAVLLATHDAERALALAGSVAVLERGGLVYLGSTAGYRTRRAQRVG